LPTQKNKHNFSTVTSRVRASPSRNHCRCQIPDEQEGKFADYTIFRWPRPANSCCRHNSSITATAVAAATPISKMKPSRHRWKITAQFHQFSVESPPFPEPRNAFHMRQDAAPIGNTTLPRTDVFTSFIRPSHEKKTCAHTDN